ncbi:DoxX family membrane protein [Synechococcales cyanobacterium C]|uniref:DoxX family membrane protein n=1 Tax=Petrachloros mirabilis ULC683 TaxID=2781853 RepID=A0A8K2A173_9CYAN|nr:DoxX family protein [Petrachloros mirabilis]NCJ07748.1 DoxX family membrane protein [Petrachloros mirabilis ULC683]
MNEQAIPTLARLLLAGIFVRAGVSHAMDLPGMQQAISAKGFPSELALVAAIAATIILLLGGTSLLLGLRVRWGAIALIIFLIPTTLLFHGNVLDSSEGTQFLKNIGLIGGLLLLWYSGPGLLSIDGPRQRSWFGKW